MNGEDIFEFFIAFLFLRSGLKKFTKFKKSSIIFGIILIFFGVLMIGDRLITMNII